MAVETLYLAALSADDLGQVTGASNAFGSGTASWSTNIDNSSWDGHFDLDAPTLTPDATQTITVNMRVRKQDGTGDPTIDSVNIRNGTTQRGINSTGWTVTSLTGQDITFTISASGLTGDGSDLSCEIVTTAAGGSPSTRAAVQLDWVSFDVTTNVATNTWNDDVSVTLDGTATVADDATMVDDVSVSADATTAITDSVVGAPGATPVIEATASGGSSSSSVTVSFGETPPDGDELVVYLWTRASNITTPTGWTRITGVGAGADDFAVFQRTASSEGTSQAFALSAADQSSWIYYRLSGYDSVRATATQDQTGATTTRSSGTTDTSPQADDLAIAAFGAREDITPSSFSNSFTQDINATNGISPFAEITSAKKTLTASGAVETTFTWTTSSTVRGMVVVFAGAATSNTYNDDVSVSADVTTATTETATLATQATSVSVDATVAVSDSATLVTQAVSVLADVAATITGQIDHADTATVAADAAATVADDATLVDAVSVLADALSLIADAVSLVDAVTVLADATSTTVDWRSLDDNVSVSADASSTVSDGRDASETVSVNATAAVSVSDAAVLVLEALSVLADAAATAADDAAWVDAISVLADATVAITDDVTTDINDFVTVLIDAAVSIVNTVDYTDGTSVAVDGSTAATDQVDFAETVAVTGDASSSASGTVDQLEDVAVLMLASDVWTVDASLVEALAVLADVTVTAADVEEMVSAVAVTGEALIAVTDWVVEGDPPVSSGAATSLRRKRRVAPTRFDEPIVPERG